MATDVIAEPSLLISDGFGIYIPQMFATRYLTDSICERCGIDVEDAGILGRGPEEEYYWEAWDSVLSNFSTLEGETIYQNGDLWLIPPDFEFPEDF